MPGKPGNRGGYGGKKGGGRPRGRRNRRTEAMVAKAEAGGAMPLDIILKQMREADARADELKATETPDAAAIREAEEVAFTRAKDAAPYLHSRLQSITQKIDPIDLSQLPRELIEQAIELEQAIERSRRGKTTH